MTPSGAWFCVLAMVVLTVYGQIVLKMRVFAIGGVRAEAGGLVGYLVTLLVDPWVWTCFAAGFLAALCWMAALSRLSLAVAYPFITLTIVAIVVLNTVVFGEPLRLLHVLGIALVGAGLLAIAYA